MKKALLIARWEFLATVTSRAYIFSVVAMPLFFGGIGASPSCRPLRGHASAGRSDGARRPGGIVDLSWRRARARARAATRSGAAAPGSSATLDGRLVEYADRRWDAPVALARAEGRQRFRARRRLPGHRRSPSTTRRQRVRAAADRQRQAQVADAIRAGLLRPRLSGDALARAYAPAARLERLATDAARGPRTGDDPLALGPFAGSFGVLSCYDVDLFLRGLSRAGAPIEDRQSRMIEILLSSVDRQQLVLGKILGLGAAGLLQVGIYVALVIVPGATLLSFIIVRWRRSQSRSSISRSATRCSRA